MAASPVGLDISKGVVLNSRATGITVNNYLDGGCKDIISSLPEELASPAMWNQQGRYPRRQVRHSAAHQHLAGRLRSRGSQGLRHLALGRRAELPLAEARGIRIQYQGVALAHAAVEQLSSSARARIFAAAVTYGETQKRQDGGKIPNFDASKTLILCNTGDLVCDGTLIITSDHLSHISSVPSGVN
ncbi:hypothetical protein CHU98_g4536 [Xylaria longipes]|nr:hypothetical protein CHU98_g4536 [Xylaria longipes]